LPRPELVVVDGAPGLEKALAALWPDMAIQRCTVHYADLRIMPTRTGLIVRACLLA
jgi:transposase-like protein